MDIDAERLRTAEIVTRAADRRARGRRDGRSDHGPPRGAGRRRLRRDVVPGRRLQAVDRGRLRGAQALRAAPDDRRHARHRRDHARAADDPGAARRLPRPRGGLARRAAAQLRQPDGDAVLGGRRGDARSAPSGSATPCRARRRSWRTTWGCPRRRSTSSPPASTTWRSSCASSTRAPTSTPRCASVTPPDWNRVRYEVLRALRLLRHRVLGALRRVRAVVHQGRPRGPDRALQRAAGRVPAPLRAPDRRVGGACAASSRRRRADRRSRTSTARTSSAPARPVSRTAFNGNVPNRFEDGPADRQPARGLLRRGAVRGLGRRGSSRSPSARSRASWRR